jgi:hypothetical protein
VDVDIDGDYVWTVPTAPAGKWWLLMQSDTYGRREAFMTIVADGPTPAVSIDDVQVSESSPISAIFTVKLSNPRTSEIVVPFTVHDVTATRNTDYRIQQSSVTFAPGEVEKQIVAQVTPDLEPEGDEKFTVELSSPISSTAVTLGKSVGTCTILDDDSAVGPAKLTIARGTTGAISVNLGSPAAAPEQIGVASSDPSIASVPSVVTLTAGASSASIPVTAGNVGETTVAVTLPQSRGGRTFTISAIAFDPTQLSFDHIGVQLEPGATTNVMARLDPPPSAPVVVSLASSNPGVALIPASVTIGTTGSAPIPIHAMTSGFTSVTATLPDLNGGIATGFRVDVAISTTMSITSLDKTSGRATGGDTIQIFGNNFAGRCVATFDDVPSQSVDTLSGVIKAVAPPHDPGVVGVAVKCGTSVSRLVNGFTYTAAPLRITQVSPSNGSSSGGTLVRVTGDNLRPGACVATFGGIAAKTIAVNQAFDLTVVAPPHAAGSADVALRCGSDSFTMNGAFSYVGADDEPATIAFASVATAAAGDRITIGGARFRADDAMFIGGVPLTDFTHDQRDSRTLTVPDLNGNAAITLRDFLGRTVVGPTIAITPPRAVTITHITSPAGIGSELSLTGTGFRRTLTYTAGGKALDPITISPANAVLRLPASLAAGDTRLEIDDAGNALASSPFTIAASKPSVVEATPPCSLTDGGSLITLTGANFADGVVVQFGSAYSADTIVRDSKTIVAKAPPSFGVFHPTITIFNSDGKSATLTDGFVYKTAAEGGCGKRRGSSH